MAGKQSPGSLVELAGSVASPAGPSAHPKLAWIVRRVVSRLTAHTEAHRRQITVELALAVERLEGDVARLAEQVRFQEEHYARLRNEAAVDAARRLTGPLRAAEARAGELEERVKELAAKISRPKAELAPSTRGAASSAPPPSPLEEMEKRLVQISQELELPSAKENDVASLSADCAARTESNRQS